MGNRLANDHQRAIAVAVVSAAYICGAYAFIGMTTAASLRESPSQPPVIESALADFAANDRAPRDCDYLATDTVVPRCPDPVGAKVALWGDSMAGAWSPAMKQPTVIYSRPDCPPLVGFVHRHQAACHGYNEAVSRRVAGMDTVYLVSRWNSVDYMQLAATLDRIAPTVRRVVVIGPTPEMQAPVPKCLRTEKDCSLSRETFDRQKRPLLAALRAMAATHPNVVVIDPTDYFCDATKCPPVRNGVPMYWDARHISASAARGFSVAGTALSAE